MTSRQANPAKPSHAKPPSSSLLLQPQRYQVGAPARHLHPHGSMLRFRLVCLPGRCSCAVTWCLVCVVRACCSKTAQPRVLTRAVL